MPMPPFTVMPAVGHSANYLPSPESLSHREEEPTRGKEEPHVTSGDIKVMWHNVVYSEYDKHHPSNINMLCVCVGK